MLIGQSCTVGVGLQPNPLDRECRKLASGAMLLDTTELTFTGKSSRNSASSASWTSHVLPTRVLLGSLPYQCPPPIPSITPGQIHFIHSQG